MKKKTITNLKNVILISFLCLTFPHNIIAQSLTTIQSDLPILKGPYLGQKTPGVIAETFAPGIISKDGWELEGVFAPGMKEFYYTVNCPDSIKDFRPTVIGYRQENNIWKPFTQFKRTGEITISPDGKQMFMAKKYKKREGNSWSKRISLGPLFDHKGFGIMRLSASSNNTYVFDDFKSSVGIRISNIINGERQAPEAMPNVINKGEKTAHPFIAPDETYIIWDCIREDGYGDSDLYISFRNEDDTWSDAINMGQSVNSIYWDAFASVTPDGKYILFNRGMDKDNDNVDIYWVDAKIIDTLRNSQKK